MRTLWSSSSPVGQRCDKPSLIPFSRSASSLVCTCDEVCVRFYMQRFWLWYCHKNCAIYHYAPFLRIWSLFDIQIQTLLKWTHYREEEVMDKRDIFGTVCASFSSSLSQSVTQRLQLWWTQPSFPEFEGCTRWVLPGPAYSDIPRGQTFFWKVMEKAATTAAKSQSQVVRLLVQKDIWCILDLFYSVLQR